MFSVHFCLSRFAFLLLALPATAAIASLVAAAAVAAVRSASFLRLLTLLLSHPCVFCPFVPRDFPPSFATVSICLVGPFAVAFFRPPRRAHARLCVSPLLVSRRCWRNLSPLPSLRTSEKFLACHTSSSLPGRAVIHDL